MSNEKRNLINERMLRLNKSYLDYSKYMISEIRKNNWDVKIVNIWVEYQNQLLVIFDRHSKYFQGDTAYIESVHDDLLKDINDCIVEIQGKIDKLKD
jgi:hypothetical protein